MCGPAIFTEEWKKSVRRCVQASAPSRVLGRSSPRYPSAIAESHAQLVEIVDTAPRSIDFLRRYEISLLVPQGAIVLVDQPSQRARLTSTGPLAIGLLARVSACASQLFRIVRIDQTDFQIPVGRGPAAPAFVCRGLHGRMVLMEWNGTTTKVGSPAFLASEFMDAGKTQPLRASQLIHAHAI
jgi:hypothetical protein